MALNVNPRFSIEKYHGPLKHIADLDAACFPDDDPIDYGRYEWWVAKDSFLRIVGYGGRKVTGDGVYLARCGVLPEGRGHHIQERLIRARVRSTGLPAFTFTHPTNVPSMRSLVRCGFMPYRPVRRWAGDTFVYWYREP